MDFQKHNILSDNSKDQVNDGKNQFNSIYDQRKMTDEKYQSNFEPNSPKETDDYSETEPSSTSDFFYDSSKTLSNRIKLYQRLCEQSKQILEKQSDENSNDDNSNNEEPQEQERNWNGADYDGFLVYIYTGQFNSNENYTFRRICMRYGLTAWNELNSYLPWRSRSDLRLTLIKMLKKQAISEYSGIRADPYVIGKDNANLEDKNYKRKGGLWVNKKIKSPKEKRKIKQRNKEKYHMDAVESLNIDVPFILSYDYIIERLQSRKINLILFNHALANEYERRTGIRLQTNGDLSQLKIMQNKHIKVHKQKIKIKSSTNISKFVFDVPEFKDK